jgi:hypothetical protein
MAQIEDTGLGAYLKDRRARLDPGALASPPGGGGRRACGARKSRSAPASAPPGTPGWNKAVAARHPPMCWIA